MQLLLHYIYTYSHVFGHILVFFSLSLFHEFPLLTPLMLSSSRSPVLYIFHMFLPFLPVSSWGEADI